MQPSFLTPASCASCAFRFACSSVGHDGSIERIRWHGELGDSAAMRSVRIAQVAPLSACAMCYCPWRSETRGVQLPLVLRQVCIATVSWVLVGACYSFLASIFMRQIALHNLRFIPGWHIFANRQDAFPVASLFVGGLCIVALASWYHLARIALEPGLVNAHFVAARSVSVINSFVNNSQATTDGREQVGQQVDASLSAVGRRNTTSPHASNTHAQILQPTRGSGAVVASGCDRTSATEAGGVGAARPAGAAPPRLESMSPRTPQYQWSQGTRSGFKLRGGSINNTEATMPQFLHGAGGRQQGSSAGQAASHSLTVQQNGKSCDYYCGCCCRCMRDDDRISSSGGACSGACTSYTCCACGTCMQDQSQSAGTTCATCIPSTDVGSWRFCGQQPGDQSRAEVCNCHFSGVSDTCYPCCRPRVRFQSTVVGFAILGSSIIVILLALKHVSSKGFADPNEQPIAPISDATAALDVLMMAVSILPTSLALGAAYSIMAEQFHAIQHNIDSLLDQMSSGTFSEGELVTTIQFGVSLFWDFRSTLVLLQPSLRVLDVGFYLATLSGCIQCGMYLVQTQSTLMSSWGYFIAGAIAWVAVANGFVLVRSSVDSAQASVARFGTVVLQLCSEVELRKLAIKTGTRPESRLGSIELSDLPVTMHVLSRMELASTSGVCSLGAPNVLTWAILIVLTSFVLLGCLKSMD